MSKQLMEHDPLDVSAQAAANSDEEKAKRLQRAREVEDFKWLMANKQGRRIMWRLLEKTGLFRNPFVPGGDGLTEFKCGEQNIGQQLLAEIHELCPEKYHEMVKEQQKDAARRRTDA